MAMCKKCKDLIESRSVHDFKMCTCGSIGVDGGHEYLRRTGHPQDILEMSVLEARDGHLYFLDENDPK